MGDSSPRRPATELEASLAYLSDVSPQDKLWDEHRTAADGVRDLYQQAEFGRYADRIQECSQRLLFALRTNEEGQEGMKLSAARFCRVRHCPVCQWRRSLMWRARFFKALPGIRADYPQHRFVFLTLTTRNCDLSELRDTLRQMNKAWKRLTERKQFPAIGWLKSVEVTRNPKTLQAHPHFHAVLMVKASYFTRNYIKKQTWAELWQSCLRVDYLPVIDVRAVKSTAAESGAGDDAVMTALCETLKYSVKEGDLLSDPVWLAELTRQLHKTRAVALGGVFKQYLSENEPEDLINSELDDAGVSESDPEFWFGWREMIKRYQSL